MKVCHVFNMANNAYHLVLALRSKGVDAELIIESKTFGMGMPFWEELEIEADPYRFIHDEAYMRRYLEKWQKPSWIHVWWQGKRRFDPLCVFELFRMVRPYDLLHLHSVAMYYLQFAGKPFVLHEAGLIRAVVEEIRKTRVRDVAFKLARRGYATSDCVVMTNPDTYPMLFNMKFKRETFLPFVIDPERYKPMEVDKPEQPLFFHPTRQFWRGKANYKLVDAFDTFIGEGGDARLRMVEWGEPDDIHAAKLKIHKAQLDSHVEWVPPYSKPALRRVFSESTAVFENFNDGSGGTNCYEAMSCAAPVCIYMNEWNVKCFGEMPPIVNVKEPDEISEAMHKLTDRKYAESVGRAERDFVKRHNAPSVVADKLIKLYEEILD